MKPHNTHARFCAFSIVEVLVAVAVLGTAAAIAIPLISTTNANVKATKLSNELKTLNLAVKSFIANGGEINPDDGLTEMIEKLKQELSDIDAQKQAGFSGQHIDSRLTPVLIDKDTKGPRLYWNPESLRFEETTKQVDGIKEFILTDYTGKRETNRKASGVYQYSDDDKGWVWNHGSAGTKNLVTPSLVSTTPSADGDDTTPILISLVPTGDSPPERVIDFPTRDPDPLAAPAFSIPPGRYKISEFHLPVVITNLNPESISDLYYSVDYGDWNEYSGPVMVPPGGLLRAQAVSTSRNFTDSDATEGEYSAQPAKLDPPIIHHNGPFVSPGQETVIVVLENPNDPTVSRIDYKVGGGPWLTYTEELLLELEDFPNGARVMAKARATEQFYNDSSVASATIGMESSSIGDDIGFLLTVAQEAGQNSGGGSTPGNGHSNNGHGNNIDGVDSSNPGQGHGGPNGEEDPSGDYDDEGGNGNGKGKGKGNGNSGSNSGSSSEETTEPADPSLIYTYTITNDSDTEVSGDVTDTLPSGLTWDEDYNPDGVDVEFSDEGRSATIVALNLPPGQTAFELRTMPTSQTGTINNEATVSPNANSPAPFNTVSDWAAIDLESYVDPEYVNFNFTKLTTSAGFLNEGFLYVNGIEYEFTNSDADAGTSLDISVLVDTGSVNTIDLKVYTTPRPHEYTELNYFSAIDGLIEIPTSESFAGEENTAAKIKHWTSGGNHKLEFGFEDLANVDPFDWGSDWDYNDYNFEITIPEWVNFNFGGHYFGE